MQNPISLKTAERKAFRTSFADGLWDVMIGCVVLEFAIAPLLSESLGDFWSSAVFLPFWGLVYLAIWLVRKWVVVPRLGTVDFSKQRRSRLRKFNITMIIINTIVFVLGLVVAWKFTSYLGEFLNIALGLFFLLAFSLAADFLDYPRLYLYGLLLAFTSPAGEWLHRHYNVPHHGYPLTFGFTSGVIIFTGLLTFVRFLKNNPVIEIPAEGA